MLSAALAGGLRLSQAVREVPLLLEHTQGLHHTPLERSPTILCPLGTTGLQAAQQLLKILGHEVSVHPLALEARGGYIGGEH